MTAALSITTSDADCRTLATDNNLAVLLGCCKDVETLNSCTQLHSCTRKGGILEVVDEVDAFQVMGPDGKSTGSSGSPQQVMSSVANNLNMSSQDGDHYHKEWGYQSDVFRLGICHCRLDIGRTRNVHRIANIVPQLAGAFSRCEWVAALVGEEGCHHRRRGIEAANMVCQEGL